MPGEAFERIRRGLEEALAFANGDQTAARVVTVNVERKPKPEKPLLAYTAYDGDEHTVVVFAKTNAHARRLAAGVFGYDWHEVCDVRRESRFDRHSPGPVPQMALLEAGWWFECSGCGRRVANEEVDRDDDPHPLGWAMEPVEFGNFIYCCIQCREHEIDLSTKRAGIKARVEAELVAEILAKYPELTVDRTHSYVDRDLQPQEVIAEFRFPGSQGTLRCERSARKGWVIASTIQARDDGAWKIYKASKEPQV